MSDSERIPCEKCGSKILSKTADVYGGLCAPCHRKLNAPPPMPPPRPSALSRICGVLIPVAFIALFFFGFPLGYKLVLGGKNSPVKKGTIHSIQFRSPTESELLVGRSAWIGSDYLVVTLDSGRELWIPETNVSAIEFVNEK